MFCPLLSLLTSGNLEECLKEKCAWWEGVERACALVSLSYKLDDIIAELSQIKEKGNYDG